MSLTLDFHGKSVLVTGGTRGIGLAIAHAFLEAGAAVTVCTNDAEELAAADKAMRGNAHAGRWLGRLADVSREAEVAGLVAAAADRWGGLDCLVNNAAIERTGTVEELEPETFARLLDVNVMGTYLASRAAIPLLRRRGGGTIINLTSVQTHISRSRMTPYTASKYAVLGLTKGMALDHAGDNIRVVAVAPGVIETGVTREFYRARGLSEEAIEAVLGTTVNVHPFRRFGRAEEVASLVLFLAHDAASFISGAEVRVDGALSCQTSNGLSPPCA